MSLLGFFNFKYDKNWLREWNRLSDRDLKEILGHRSRIKLNYFKPVCYEAYEFGSQQKKLISRKDISKRTRKILDNYNLPKLLMYLSGKAGNTEEPEIRQTISGLLQMRAVMELESPGEVYQALWYFIVDGIEDEPEFLLVAFREISRYSFKNKLFGFIDIFTNLSFEVQEKLRDEWLSIVRKANYFDSNPELDLFQTDEDIWSFVRMKTLQKKLLKEQVIATQDYIEALWKNLENAPNKQTLFLLYLYYLSLEIEPPEIEKIIIGDLLRKIPVSRNFLQKIIFLYRQTNQENTFLNFPLYLNFFRKYLEKYPLDEQLYRQIFSLFMRANMSKYRQANDLLLSRKKDFQGTSLQKVFPYLHTGMFMEYHGKLLEHNQLVNSQKEIILIQSQVITTEITDIKHRQLTIKIDGKIVPAKQINNFLQTKGVPYRWISFYRKNEESDFPVFIHSLLLNRNEYQMLDSYLSLQPEYTRTNIFGFAEFTDDYQTDFRLKNDLKILQKIAVNTVGDQVFINEIRWKNIKTNIVDKFPDVKIWYEIMHHIISYTGSVKPSKTWWANMKKLAGKLSPDAFEMGMLRLLFDVAKNPFWYQKSQVKPLRGMIWATTLINPYDAVIYLEKILLMSYERPAGKGQPRSLSGASSAMSALIKIDTYDSYKVLKQNYVNSDYERFTNQLLTALDEFERSTKLSVEKLREIE